MSTVLPDHLREALDYLGFAGHEGLVTTDAQLDAGARDYIWRDLQDKVGLEAVFFQDGIPLVGFSTATGKGLKGLRKRLWNYGRVPLLVSSDGHEVSAYNASGLDSSSLEGAPLVTASVRRAKTAESLLMAFSRSQVEGGRYVTEFASIFARSIRVDQALLRNLAFLRRAIEADEPRGHAVDTLVGGCLLASYMADRGVLDARHVSELSGSATLLEAFTSGRASTKRLFEGLATHFNGDIFGRMPGVLDQIQEIDLARVAGLLRGDDLPTGQGALWPYDFAVLPADLVSSVYEQLLEPTRKTDAAFYTPRFLVDLVLDEVLQWDGALPEIIDLACGSGAFITEAFRRMTYRLRGSLGRDATYEELIALLQKHVFGIDKSPSAATVTIFGLYLALLEELDPPTVWDTAVLPSLLGSNVLVGDAFAESFLISRKFDVVVSNPPWTSRLTPDASSFVARSDVPVADKQMAEAFLWLANSILRPGGVLGLVLPAKGLLHNRGPRAIEFRRHVFKSMDVRAIVDLSAVRRTIFETAIAPAAVLIADAMDSGSPVMNVDGFLCDTGGSELSVRR